MLSRWTVSTPSPGMEQTPGLDAAPVPSVVMPAGPPRSGAAEGGGAGDPAAEDQARAAEALRGAFTRLAPQGSDAWNFLAAFTHLGDRYGRTTGRIGALGLFVGPRR